MKPGTCVPLFLILVLASSAVFAQRTANTISTQWATFTYRDEGFLAKFPNEPVLSVQDQVFPGFTTKFRRYRSKDSHGNSFEVGHAIYPAGLGEKEEFFDTLSLAISNLVAQFKGRITERNEIVVRGCSGREIIGSVGGGYQMRVRMFSTGEHLYQLTAVGDADQRTNASVENFLNSFTIIDGCHNRIASKAAPSEPVHSKIEGVLDSVTGWRRIVSANDGLEMLMPGATNVEEQEVTAGITLKTRSFVSYQESATYYVNVTGDYPPGLVDAGKADLTFDVLEMNLKRELASLNPKLTILRKLNLGKNPGREYKIEADGRVGRAQVFLTPRKRYLIIASDSDENPSALTNIARFLNAIRISPN